MPVFRKLLLIRTWTHSAPDQTVCKHTKTFMFSIMLNHMIFVSTSQTCSYIRDICKVWCNSWIMFVSVSLCIDLRAATVSDQKQRKYKHTHQFRVCNQSSKSEDFNFQYLPMVHNKSTACQHHGFEQVPPPRLGCGLYQPPQGQSMVRSLPCWWGNKRNSKVPCKFQCLYIGKMNWTELVKHWRLNEQASDRSIKTYSNKTNLPCSKLVAEPCRTHSALHHPLPTELRSEMAGPRL